MLGQGLGKQLETGAAEAERNERLHPTPDARPVKSQPRPGLAIPVPHEGLEGRPH